MCIPRVTSERNFLRAAVQRGAPRCILFNSLNTLRNKREKNVASPQPHFEGSNSERGNETAVRPQHTIDDVEIQEWLESLDSVLETSGPEVAAEILERLRAHATVNGIDLPFSANTPYANSIPARLQPLFPGDQELERRIKSRIRGRHGLFSGACSSGHLCARIYRGANQRTSTGKFSPRIEAGRGAFFLSSPVVDA